MTPIKLALAALVLAAATAAVPGVAAASDPAIANVRPGLVVSDDDRALLTKAETLINGIRTLKARFYQNSTNGSAAQGTVWIQRPGRMRLEYDPPAQMLLVSNGTHLVFHDKDVDQFTYIDLDDTPAGILLAEKVSLADRDVRLESIRRAAGLLEITVSQNGQPGSGTLTLSFSERPFQLKQWRVTDAQGVETAVTLYDAVVNDPSVISGANMFRDPKLEGPNLFR